MSPEQGPAIAPRARMLRRWVGVLASMVTLAVPSRFARAEPVAPEPVASDGGTGGLIDREWPRDTPKAALRGESAPLRTAAVYGVIGGPLLLGAEGVLRVGPILELSAGAGVSLDDAGEPGIGSSIVNWSLMPRLRIGGLRWAVTVGAGISGRPVVHHCGILEEECSGADERTGYLTFANAELGAERWASRGFAVRFFVGYGWALDPDDLVCASGSETCLKASASGPYTGVGLGYAF